MKDDLVLARVDKAVLVLAEAKTIQEVKQVMALAQAAAVYGKQIGATIKAQNYAGEIRLRAERRLGEMLKGAPKRTAAQFKGGGSKGSKREPLPDAPPSLKEVNVSRKQSSQSQALAAMPEKEFEKALAVEPGKELVCSRVVREAEKTRKRVERKVKTALWPAGKYRVIYADPPWAYGDKRLGTVGGGGATGHYEDMPTEKICELPVPHLCLKESVIFLWVTSPLLPDGLRVLSAWGFTYKASFVWDKVRGFNGHYNDVQHELLLIGTKGSCTPDAEKLPKSIVRVEKDRHSRKPERFREIIQDLYPDGPRVELFARNKAEGWDAWGNEV